MQPLIGNRVFGRLRLRLRSETRIPGRTRSKTTIPVSFRRLPAGRLFPGVSRQFTERGWTVSFRGRVTFGDCLYRLP